MIDAKLLALLRCPIDAVPLAIAPQELIDQLNDAIGRGELRDRLDQKVLEPIEQGLVTENQKRLYPVRGSIPTLIGDDAIELK